MDQGKSSVKLREQIPMGYYWKSIESNPFQRFWHLSRFKRVSELIEPVDGHVLDIGCADGAFTQVIIDKANPKKIIGIDIIENLINDTKKRFKDEKRAEFMVADANNLPFPDNKFDAVFCLEALEHVENPSNVLGEIRRVLRVGGYLVLLVPTDNLLFKVAWWVVLHTWGKHWKETHIQSFSKRNSLVFLVTESGLAVEQERKFLWNMLVAVKARKNN